MFIKVCRATIQLILLLNLLLIGSLSASTLVEPLPSLINSHIYQRHIDKTEQQLRQRLEKESISAASTFDNRVIAEQVIEQALIYHQARIDNYLSQKNSRKLVLNYQAQQRIGFCVLRTSPEPIITNKVRLVLVQDPQQPRGFHLITSYPIP